MLVRLLRVFLRPYRGALVAVVVLQFVQSVAGLYLPRLNAEIIDQGIAQDDRGLILATGGLMLLLSLLQISCAIGAVYFGARAAMGFGRDARGAIFHHVGSFSTREVEGFGAPSLITRITNDVSQVQVLVLMLCTMLLAAPITAIGGTVMAMREDIGLSIVLAVGLPLMLIYIAAIIRRMIPQYRRLQERIDEVNRVLREQLMGLRVIRAFVREPSEEQRFGEANRELTSTWLVAGRLFASLFPIVMLVAMLSSVAVVWLGAGRIEDGSLQVGELVAFLTYLTQILMSTLMAAFIAVMWPRAAVCAERIVEVLDTASSVEPPAAPVGAVPPRATVEMRAVGFRYPGAEAGVLSEISFTVGPGQTTAIIGSTGSGKTTLVHLIPRFFDVTSGAVLVDGVDVRHMEPEDLWRRIGIVPQRPYLFSGTVAGNLRYADPDATDDELWAALDIAQASEFVQRMPGALDAPIDQGGTNVSGGQRQRLAIARALVRRPEIFLFDDSFSALDLATDARLRAALAPHVAEAAMIVVAQRVSTIVHADQILVLEDGRIVGRGRHGELVETCVEYREIVESQLAATGAQP
jgi:ATP-binding cassette, subfamily B, multidrug efflux pump